MRAIQSLYTDSGVVGNSSQRSGARVLGVKAIPALDPQTRPTSVARSPAPLVHAATKAARKPFYEIYAEFVSAFRAAADALRQGRQGSPRFLGDPPCVHALG